MANYWLHNEFLNLENAKMSKSDGNFITLLTLTEKGYSPLAYRYFLLQSHYRKQTIFSFEALDSAQKGLEHLYASARNIDKKSKASKETKEIFLNFINNDLDIPGALAFVWEKIKEKKIDLKTLLKFDEVFGLKIKENLKETKIKISDDAEKIKKERDTARTNKDWKKSDELRAKLESMGYKVEDTKEGTKISK